MEAFSAPFIVPSSLSNNPTGLPGVDEEMTTIVIRLWIIMRDHRQPSFPAPPATPRPVAISRLHAWVGSFQCRYPCLLQRAVGFRKFALDGSQDRSNVAE